MRLSTKEIAAIKSGFDQELLNISFELYLFGSRLDDQKKGGDIDLLLIVPEVKKYEVSQLKSRIRLRIFEKIAEQKIDITVATSSEINTDPFLSTVFKKAVLL